MKAFKYIFLFLLLGICVTILSNRIIHRNDFDPKKNLSSIVHLNVYQDFDNKINLGTGTGIFVTNRDILTNYHVVKLAKGIFVKTQQGKTHKANLRAKDIKTDLAILTLTEINEKHVPLSISRSKVSNNQTVYMLNFRNAYEGKILNSNLLLDVEGGVPFRYIEFGTTVNDGDSGSALLNTRGELIGLVTLKSSRNNNGFAIPINQAKVVIDNLLNKGFYDHAVLGINTTIIPYKAERYTGVVVNQVIPNSPASRVDLKPLDIITKVDRISVSIPQDISCSIFNRKPGDQITISIIRNNEEKKIKVKLGSLIELMKNNKI